AARARGARPDGAERVASGGDPGGGGAEHRVRDRGEGAVRGADRGDGGDAGADRPGARGGGTVVSRRGDGDLRARVRGVFTAMVTPTRRGKVDLKGVRELVGRRGEGGIAGLCPGGATG